MKDETGQPIVCIHCGEQAIVLYGPRNVPMCAKHFHDSVRGAVRDMLIREWEASC